MMLQNLLWVQFFNSLSSCFIQDFSWCSQMFNILAIRIIWYYIGQGVNAELKHCMSWVSWSLVMAVMRWNFANVEHLKQITLTFWLEFVFLYLGSGSLIDPSEMLWLFVCKLLGNIHILVHEYTWMSNLVLEVRKLQSSPQMMWKVTIRLVLLWLEMSWQKWLLG